MRDNTMEMTIPKIVHHKEYGDGEVIKIATGKIYVKFSGRLMIFPYPEALDKGYLTLYEISTSDVESSLDDPDFLLPKDIKQLDAKARLQTQATISIASDREVILDAADKISYRKIYEALNATVGTNYSGWMKAGWPDGKPEYPFWIWFPKLAETKDGKLVSAAFDCVNTISDDWNEVIFEDLKDTPPEIDGNWRTSPILIFAKEPKGGPYIFRGVYVHDTQRSRYRHHVVTRIGTRVKLIGQPAEGIVIVDDFRR